MALWSTTQHLVGSSSVSTKKKKKNTRDEEQEEVEEEDDSFTMFQSLLFSLVFAFLSFVFFYRFYFRIGPSGGSGKKKQQTVGKWWPRCTPRTPFRSVRKYLGRPTLWRRIPPPLLLLLLLLLVLVLVLLLGAVSSFRLHRLLGLLRRLGRFRCAVVSCCFRRTCRPACSSCSRVAPAYLRLHFVRPRSNNNKKKREKPKKSSRKRHGDNFGLLRFSVYKKKTKNKKQKTKRNAVLFVLLSGFVAFLIPWFLLLLPGFTGFLLGLIGFF